MANEISVACSLTGTKTGTTVTGSTTKQITLTGSALFANTQNIGTSTEQVVFDADAVAEGITYVYLKNDDATNYVEIGNAALAVIYGKLLAGQAVILAVNKAAASDPSIYARANTAACNLKIVAVGT